jgi:hypothetical protein
MARPRTANVMLPRDVQKVVKPSGRAYYYYAPGRGTAGAGKRIPLGSDTADPEFWRLLRAASTPAAAREGTLSKLIAEYRASKEWADLRPASKQGYGHFLDRLEAGGGDRPVAAMTRRDIYALLDQMSGTPFAANYMLAVLRTLLEFGVPRGYRDDNPAIGVKRLKVEDSGHAPWPETGYSFVMENAPVHLRRMAFLGRATGQRISDLVILPQMASTGASASCATSHISFRSRRHRWRRFDRGEPVTWNASLRRRRSAGDSASDTSTMLGVSGGLRMRPQLSAICR